MEIPMVVGAERIVAHAQNGDPIALDGDAGAVFLRPDEALFESISEKIATAEAARARYEALRDNPDLVEREGIRRAREALEHADAVLWVRDAGDPDSLAPSGLPDGVPTITVWNKIDISLSAPRRVYCELRDAKERRDRVAAEASIDLELLTVQRMVRILFPGAAAPDTGREHRRARDHGTLHSSELWTCR